MTRGVHTTFQNLNFFSTQSRCSCYKQESERGLRSGWSNVHLSLPRAVFRSWCFIAVHSRNFAASLVVAPVSAVYIDLYAFLMHLAMVLLTCGKTSPFLSLLMWRWIDPGVKVTRCSSELPILGEKLWICSLLYHCRHFDFTFVYSA